MFLNLSNHPSAGWSEAQRQAAMALIQKHGSSCRDDGQTPPENFGEWPANEDSTGECRGTGAGIVDLPFPNVDPKAGPDEIDRMASEQVARLQAAGLKSGDIVHVMGELTLTYQIVRRLKSLGVTCVAATTERIVTTQPDGKKLSEFHFIQFRPY